MGGAIAHDYVGPTTNPKASLESESSSDCVWEVSGPAEVELTWDPLELTPVDSWIYQRLKIYRETRIELSEALNEQRLNRPQPGKSRPPAELQPGDLVLVFNPEALISETRGLRFKWKGPHVVHRRTGAVNYLIWEDGKLKVFHLSRIIPYDPSGLTEENPVLEQVKELRKEYQVFLRTLAAEMIGQTYPQRSRPRVGSEPI